MMPEELAKLDQADMEIRDHLAVFGVDIDDPTTLATVIGTVEFLAVTFKHSPGVDRDGILRGLLRGLLLSVETLREARE
jgi:hypothetical protein